MARKKVNEVAVFGEKAMPAREPAGDDSFGSLFGSGSISDASVQILARPAPFACIIQMIALRLEGPPGARGTAQPPPESIRLHLGVFSVQSGGMFGGDTAALLGGASRTVAVLGVDPNSREPQSLELKTALTIPRDHYVGLINIAGGALNLRYEMRDVIWRGDRTQGFWTWTWSGGGQAAVESLDARMALASQFRYRTSWFCIGQSMKVRPLKEPLSHSQPSSVSHPAQAPTLPTRKAFEEPVIREATASESEDKRQRLAEPEELVEELVLDEPPADFM